MRVLQPACRIAALLLVVGALVSRADCVLVSGTCRATNLLSFFTIQSNIAYAVLLLALVVRAILGRREGRVTTALRALVTTYLIVSGLTFAVLIANAGLDDYTFLVPTSSKILHFVVPVYAVIDFLAYPGRQRLPWSSISIAFVYPAVYAVYTLLRGRAVSWYPYVFLDPTWVGGYGGVALFAAVLGAAILVLMTALVALTRLPRHVPHGR